MRLIGRLALTGLALTFLFSCSKSETSAEKTHSIAVFIPGVVAGSPTYEALVAGVQGAAAERDGASVKIVEGGFSQGEWLDGVTALAAARSYDTVITTNPALPEICAQVATQFPDQKFVVLDGYLEGNSAIHTLLYNQMEQSYLVGHMAGLITSSELSGANESLRVGLIAGQEYPTMNRVIRIGFELGVKEIDPEATVDFRVVGNWFDATRASELASIMYDAGSDVILAIAGGANQGVIAEARRRGAYVLWFDSNGYDEAPGVVLGSSAVEQQRAAYEKTLAAIDGNIAFGEALVVDVADGYVTFIVDDPLYVQHVPVSLREAQSNAIRRIADGRMRLVMPRL